MNRQAALIFYFLSAYVVMQFIWWGFHLTELTKQINTNSDFADKRVTMIIGEGIVFLSLLLLGIWKIRRSIKKELKLSQRQKNFLLSVTHELKTPLAANKLYIQTVQKRELDKEQANEILSKAIEENVRLERMIDNILNASRIENNALHSNSEKFDLSELMRYIVDRFTSISKASSIKIEAGANIEIQADKFMVETILNNLIENAIKYAGKDNNITVYAQKEGNQLIFGVKDEGPGITDANKQEVFKKFFRVGNEDTRSQKGTGLGLYIVSQLVRIQNGTIKCMDNSPFGVNFQIKI